VHLVDIEYLWLRLPSCSFRVLEHGVVHHHLVKIFSSLTRRCRRT
jgi:hypothetical protein